MASEENQESYDQIRNLAIEIANGDPSEHNYWNDDTAKHTVVIIADEHGYKLMGCEHAELIVGMVSEATVQNQIIKALVKSKSAEFRRSN